MSHTISRHYVIEIAHYLTKVPKAHRCARMHGHSMHIEVGVATVESGLARSARLQGQAISGLDSQGMVVDFAVVDKAWKPTFKLLDHSLLNDNIDNPTSENVARFVFERMQRALRRQRHIRVTHVTVNETTRAGATYRPTGG